MARGGKRRSQHFYRTTYYNSDTTHDRQTPPRKKAKVSSPVNKRVPVDFAFAAAVGGDVTGATVFQQDGCIYDAHLHQASLSSRRHATCLLQVVATSYGYYVWQRHNSWHEDDPTSNDVTSTDLSPLFVSTSLAIDSFTSEFEQKTGVAWVDRVNNVTRLQVDPFDGLYCYVAMEYPSTHSLALLDHRCLGPSLHTDVRKLMSILYKDDQDRHVIKPFDTIPVPMPLPLPYAQVAIELAHSILDQVEATLQAKGPRGRRAKLLGWSNRYFSAIPHTYPPRVMLDSMEKVENCRETLKELHMTSPSRSFLHHLPPLDNLEQKYAALGVDLEVVPKESLEYDLVATYLHNSKDHVQYEMKIQAVYRVMKEDETMAFKRFERFGNRKLLWHGSSMTNWPGILKDGESSYVTIAFKLPRRT
ncbi:hypothetical protein H257_13666 [Aphanomyces astaci]|uniref:Poly [ADP-ribose] polymerase n=1 Tax=Aphanomyces astaci TaxID=112090 RepID=W4FVD0_APHAT|nr:hypothetical protein H257_13666 [Aphanomyces astaci]ETV70911.1 hypothetical protein H257_13666 [Aphanomyces astaci]|eukprot:XP_009839574.1 hypothetical protein H257_13666 [Aphanomyces astaci]